MRKESLKSPRLLGRSISQLGKFDVDHQFLKYVEETTSHTLNLSPEIVAKDLLVKQNELLKSPLRQLQSLYRRTEQKYKERAQNKLQKLNKVSQFQINTQFLAVPGMNDQRLQSQESRSTLATS
ncbi:UNKNOWN [Stylonychia lemnae]|uniref:Uncharacterized protein n=1 Tax=Stylonychia lemnae TaxID=5949 RepID=A0A078A624_STYLE|nr:UNKNOWN [Stylonychia lemnae]|eukprot:CDW77346.1 UNKNOWN [Stylonychia lemnae]